MNTGGLCFLKLEQNKSFYYPWPFYYFLEWSGFKAFSLLSKDGIASKLCQSSWRVLVEMLTFFILFFYSRSGSRTEPSTWSTGNLKTANNQMKSQIGSGAVTFPCLKKLRFESWIRLKAPLCRVCMFSLSPCGFLPGNPLTFHSLKTCMIGHTLNCL